MATKEYVLVYPRVVNTRVCKEILLVEKDRPDWQKGRLNLVGGKIEPEETPEDAAIRELWEEAGLAALPNVKTVGKIVGSWGVVHCVKVPILFGQTISPAEGETEEVNWYDWEEVKWDKRLLPNLKIVIPLMALGSSGWVVSDEGAVHDGQINTSAMITH